MIAITSSPDSRPLVVADGAERVVDWLTEWHVEFRSMASGIHLDYQAAWVRDRISDRYTARGGRLNREEYWSVMAAARADAPEILTDNIPVMALISKGFPAPDRVSIDLRSGRRVYESETDVEDPCDEDFDAEPYRPEDVQPARPVPVGRRLRAGHSPDRLFVSETKTEGLASPYVELAKHKRIALVIEVSGTWTTGAGLVAALSAYAAAGCLPGLPHAAVIDRDDPHRLRAQLWWLFPEQSWVWMDSSDPRWRRNSVDFYRDLLRNLGAAMSAMPGAETATAVDLPVVMSPFCSRWERHVIQQSDFRGLGEMARALRAAAPRTSAAPSTDPAGDAYRAGKPRAISALRTAASRHDQSYLASLGDDAALARWIADKIRADVCRSVLGDQPDRADDRRMADVERGIAAAAREIAAWWDPAKFRGDGKRRGRDADVGADLPRAARQALAGRRTSDEKAAKNGYVNRIAEAIVALTDESGDHPSQSAVVRHTGIPKQSVNRWWRAAETLAAVLSRDGRQAASEHLEKSSRFIAGPVPARREIDDVRIDDGGAQPGTGKLATEAEIDKLFLAVLGPESLEPSPSAPASIEPKSVQQDAVDDLDDDAFQRLADLLGDEALEDSAPPICVSACNFDPLARGIGVQN